MKKPAPGRYRLEGPQGTREGDVVVDGRELWFDPPVTVEEPGPWRLEYSPPEPEKPAEPYIAWALGLTA